MLGQTSLAKLLNDFFAVFAQHGEPAKYAYVNPAALQPGEVIVVPAGLIIRIDERVPLDTLYVTYEEIDWGGGRGR